MKYTKKAILLIFIASAFSLAFAKSVTFNIKTNASCKLEQVGAGSQYKEGVTYSPAPPLHLAANSSTRFKVNIVPSKIPYNTNNELLSGFYLQYDIDCPSADESGSLVISGNYYDWKYSYTLHSNSKKASSTDSDSGLYDGWTKYISIDDFWLKW